MHSVSAYFFPSACKARTNMEEITSPCSLPHCHAVLQAACAWGAASVVARCVAGGGSDGSDGSSLSGAEAVVATWEGAAEHFRRIETMQQTAYTAHQRALMGAEDAPASVVNRVVNDGVESKAYLLLGGVNLWASARSVELMLLGATRASAAAGSGSTGKIPPHTHSLQAHRAREDFDVCSGRSSRSSAETGSEGPNADCVATATIADAPPPMDSSTTGSTPDNNDGGGDTEDGGGDKQRTVSKSIYCFPPRICSRTLMEYSDPISVLSRDGSLLPSIYADGR